jgi:hypothetical protein
MVIDLLCSLDESDNDMSISTINEEIEKEQHDNLCVVLFRVVGFMCVNLVLFFSVHFSRVVGFMRVILVLLFSVRLVFFSCSWIYAC